MLGGCWDDVASFESLKPEQSTLSTVHHHRCYAAKSFATRQRRAPAVDEDPVFVKCLRKIRKEGITIPLYFDYEQVFTVSDFNWDSLPASVSAAGGHLPTKRIQRKVIQIENLIKLAAKFIDHLMAARTVTVLTPTPTTTTSATTHENEFIRVCEFCAGSGFICLPLAAMYPTVEFVLLDRKGKSLEIGKERIQAAGLSNVRVVDGDIADYNEPFHVGIALHACGSASDVSLVKCIESRAACKINIMRKAPLSGQCQQSLSQDMFRHLVRAADFGHSMELSLCSAVNAYRRICKSMVEEDRRLYAQEHGYRAYLTEMRPKGASPKDDVLLGWWNPEGKNESLVSFQQEMGSFSGFEDVYKNWVTDFAPLVGVGSQSLF